MTASWVPPVTLAGTMRSTFAPSTFPPTTTPLRVAGWPPKRRSIACLVIPESTAMSGELSNTETSPYHRLSNPAAIALTRNGPGPRLSMMYVPSSAVATDRIGCVEASDRYISIVAPLIPVLDERATTLPVMVPGSTPAAGSAFPKACSRILLSVVVASTTFFKFLENTIPNIDAAIKRPTKENSILLMRGV